MYEIEQKFIFDELPQNELEFIQHTIVYRQYLSSNPEIRINRRVFDDGEERYNLTFKEDSMMEVFIKLWEIFKEKRGQNKIIQGTVF